jgi:hypothetical protein
MERRPFSPFENCSNGRMYSNTHDLGYALTSASTSTENWLWGEAKATGGPLSQSHQPVLKAE